MGNLAQKIKNFVSVIEDTSIPAIYYFLTFFGVITIENFLEIFSDTGWVPFKLFPFNHESFLSAGTSIAIWFTHNCLWWVAVAFAFPIILTLLTRRKIDKTLRIVLGVTPIVVLTPIVDLILSAGKGIEIHYITPTGLAAFLPPHGVTPGEFLTGILFLTVIFSYCLIKTKKITTALLGVLCSYAVILIFFILPTIMGKIAALLKVSLLTTRPIPVIRFFCVIIFAEVFILLYLKDKNIFKNIYPSKAICLVLCFILGVTLRQYLITTTLIRNFSSFILTIFAIIGTYSVAITLNRPYHKNTKSVIGAVFLVTAICALAVNFTTFYFALIALSLITLHSLPPLQLKRVPVFSKFLISAGLLLLVLLGWLFAGGELRGFPHIFSLYFLIFPALCLNFMDLESKEKWSILNLFGKKKSKLLIGIVILISYLILPLLLLDPLLFFPMVILAVLQCYLVSSVNYKDKYAFFLHAVTLSVLAFWLNYF
ncbi:MAG: UbiA family prenyltransferase [Candidatus Omnitrophica bacterium]|nr:UbiA family prenyltransferase [Candidatus Omnitrophota bacterium]